MVLYDSLRFPKVPWLTCCTMSRDHKRCENHLHRTTIMWQPVALCDGRNLHRVEQCINNSSFTVTDRYKLAAWRSTLLQAAFHLSSIASHQVPCTVVYEPGSKLLVLGMGNLQPLIGNPYNGYINPYYWVDEFIPYYMEIMGV